MNCPSRVDETLLHPTWNQSPPFLAPDLTTRQDLGGIANSREHRDTDQGTGLGFSDAGDAILPQYHDESKKDRTSVGSGREGLPLKDCQKSFEWQHTSRLNSINAQPQGFFQSKHFPIWFLGIGCILTLINGVMLLCHYSVSSSAVDRFASTSGTGAVNGLKVLKRDTCSADGGAESDYDFPLHVGAVFIILFVSGTACAFPLVALKIPRLRIPSTFLFAARHFGTGVLIATAFVHLLPTAFTMLGDPCLNSFWTSDYPAMPGAIVLAAVFFVTIVEMVFTPVRSCYPSSAQTSEFSSRTGIESAQDNQVEAPTRSVLSRTFITTDDHVPMRNLGLLKGRSSSVGQRVSRMAENQEIMEIREAAERQQSSKDSPENACSSQEPQNDRSSLEVELTPEQKHKKAVMQCALLELGILFHSVFIGMALSVSSGNDFVVLLIAIVFHQTFEGLALGSRIADIKWQNKAVQPWLMALAYGCTTPVGQALGLGLHSLYDPASEVGLLLVGIMNAISSGLLVYASLVELLSEDFLSDESWRVLRGKRRIYACILVFLGAFGMSLIGAWA